MKDWHRHCSLADKPVYRQECAGNYSGKIKQRPFPQK